MNKTYLIISMLCLSLTSNAQNTFEKIIDTLGPGGASCVQQTFDGGYIICGGSSLNGGDGMAIKLDSAGTIEWVKTYGGPGGDAINYIEQLPDSGYIMNGTYDIGFNGKNWFLRLDKNGDTLWTNLIPLLGGFSNQLAVNFIHQYGSTGYYHNVSQWADIYLHVLNDSNSILTAKVYNNTPFGSQGQAIDKTFDNGFIITGSLATTSITGRTYLIRTDSLGDTLWTKTYLNSLTDIGNSVQQTSDSGFVLAGIEWNNAVSKYNLFVIRTTSTGDTIWTKSYYSAIGAGANSIQQTSDGGFVVAGIISPSPTFNPNVYLIKLNGIGDTIWTRQFGDTLRDIGSFVRQTKDGGYIICGSGVISGAGGIYLIKTDSMGNVPGSVGIPEVNNEFAFDIYPNPSNGNFNIRLKAVNSKKAWVDIYNIHDQIVFSYSINSANSNKDISIKTTDGIYIVVLRTNDHVYSRKIIIKN